MSDKEEIDILDQIDDDFDIGNEVLDDYDDDMDEDDIMASLTRDDHSKNIEDSGFKANDLDKLLKDLMHDKTPIFDEEGDYDVEDMEEYEVDDILDELKDIEEVEDENIDLENLKLEEKKEVPPSKEAIFVSKDELDEKELAKRSFSHYHVYDIMNDANDLKMLDYLGTPVKIEASPKYIAIGTLFGFIILYDTLSRKRVAILGSLVDEQNIRMIEIYQSHAQQDEFDLYNQDAPRELKKITFIEFSKQSPNLISAGYSDGAVTIWDTSTFLPVVQMKNLFKSFGRIRIASFLEETSIYKKMEKSHLNQPKDNPPLIRLFIANDKYDACVVRLEQNSILSNKYTITSKYASFNDFIPLLSMQLPNHSTSILPIPEYSRTNNKKHFIAHAYTNGYISVALLSSNDQIRGFETLKPVVNDEYIEPCVAWKPPLLPNGRYPKQNIRPIHPEPLLLVSWKDTMFAYILTKGDTNEEATSSTNRNSPLLINNIEKASVADSEGSDDDEDDSDDIYGWSLKLVGQRMLNFEIKKFIWLADQVVAAVDSSLTQMTFISVSRDSDNLTNSKKNITYDIDPIDSYSVKENMITFSSICSLEQPDRLIYRKDSLNEELKVLSSGDISINRLSKMVLALGQHEIHGFMIKRWNDRIDQLEDKKEFKEALEIAVAAYNGSGKLIVGISADEIERKRKLSDRIKVLMKNYIENVSTKKDSKQAEKVIRLSMTIKDCVEYSLMTNDESIFFFVFTECGNNETRNMFISCLYRHIIPSTKYPKLLNSLYINNSPEILKEFISYYKIHSANDEDWNKFALCMLNIDLNGATKEELIQITEEHNNIKNMHRLFFYVYNKLKGSFKEPAKSYLKRIPEYKRSTIDKRNSNGNYSDNVGDLTREMLFEYLNKCFSSELEVFEQGSGLENESNRKKEVKLEILEFLFERSTTNTRKLPFINLNKLLFCDPQETFKLLFNIFLDNSSSSPFKKVKGQKRYKKEDIDVLVKNHNKFSYETRIDYLKLISKSFINGKEQFHVQKDDTTYSFEQYILFYQFVCKIVIEGICTLQDLNVSFINCIVNLIENDEYQKKHQKLLTSFLEKVIVKEVKNKAAIGTTISANLDYVLLNKYNIRKEDRERLKRICQDKKRYTIAAMLYKAEDKFEEAIKLFTKDDSTKEEVFPYIEQVLDNSPKPKQDNIDERAKSYVSMRESVLNNLDSLMAADPVKTSSLLLKRFPDKHNKILSILSENNPKLLYEYLKVIFERSKEEKSNEPNIPLDKIDQDLSFVYLKLLCSYAPHLVRPFLNENKISKGNLNELQKICNERHREIKKLRHLQEKEVNELEIQLMQLSKNNTLSKEDRGTQIKSTEEKLQNLKKLMVPAARELDGIQDAVALIHERKGELQEALDLVMKDINKLLEIIKGHVFKRSQDSKFEGYDDKLREEYYTKFEKGESVELPMIEEGVYIQNLPDVVLARKKLEEEAIQMCIQNQRKKLVRGEKAKDLWFNLYDAFNKPLSVLVDVITSGSKEVKQTGLDEEIKTCKENIVKNQKKCSRLEKVLEKMEGKENKDNSTIEQMKDEITELKKKNEELQNDISLIEKKKRDLKKKGDLYETLPPLSNLWMQRILTEFSYTVVFNMIGYVALPDLLKKIIDDNKKNTLGRVKILFVHLLRRYNHSHGILECINSIVEKDAYNICNDYHKSLSKALANYCSSDSKVDITNDFKLNQTIRITENGNVYLSNTIKNQNQINKRTNVSIERVEKLNHLLKEESKLNLLQTSSEDASNSTFAMDLVGSSNSFMLNNGNGYIEFMDRTELVPSSSSIDTQIERRKPGDKKTQTKSTSILIELSDLLREDIDEFSDEDI